jgi:hypothetical protein
MDRVYGVATGVYWLIILYFLAMMFWKLITESKLSMQIAISIAMIPFLYRLLGIK